jgi:hypothetical protein
MDETTFQHQLRELKQRVSDMTDTSSSWLPVPRPDNHPSLAPGVAPNYHQDLYTAQLQDVKLKLDSMQGNLPKQSQVPAVQTKIPLTAMPDSPDKLDYVRRDIQILAGTIEASNDLAKQRFDGFKRILESMSWQMHTNFDSLVSKLGENNTFTPDSSEATDEDLTAAQEGFPADMDAVPDDGHVDSGTAKHDGYPREPSPTSKPPLETPGLAREQNPNSDDRDISPLPRLHQRPGPWQGYPEDALRRANERIAATLGYHGPVGDKEEVALPQANCHGFSVSAKDQYAEGAGDPFLQGRQGGFEGVTQRIQETCPRPAVLSEPFMAVCPPKIVPNNYPDWLANISQLPHSCNDTSTRGQATHQHDDATKEKRQFDETWSHIRTSPQEQTRQHQRANQPSGTREAVDVQVVARSHMGMISPEQAQIWMEQSTNQQLRDTIAAKEEEISELTVGQIADRRDMAEKDATIAHLNDCKSAAEEAFEITRSNLERRLIGSENEIRQWEQNLEAMAGDQEARELENGRLKHELRQCEASRHHFMTKYVDENYRFKWLEQRKFQSEHDLKLQLDDYEGALEHHERNREADIRSALQSRDQDLDKLHVFCKEKDAVIYRQEQIIAEGASILGERDAEIDRLSAALDESKRSEQDAREHAAKNKRTIQKRDAQLEDLHREAKGERERRCRLEDLMRRDAEAMRAKAKDVRFSADERNSGRSFANAADVPAYAVNRGHAGLHAPLWTPQPIRSSARLPHEEDRASFWEDGEHAATKHKFGSSSPIAQQRRKSGRGGSNSQRNPRERDDHKRPSLSNNATQEAPRGQHRQHSAMHPDASCHQSEPLASNREALQLLAGWTETLQGKQKNSRLQDQQPLGPPHLTRQTHADMSHKTPAAGGSGGGHRSPSSRMKAQAPTNGGTAENGRHALPLDTTWFPAPAQPVVERVGSVPDLRAGSRGSDGRNHASREYSAMSKPASMFDLRPQKGHMPSPRQSQTYRAPSVETEAESSSADEREQQQQRNSLVDYS